MSGRKCAGQYINLDPTNRENIDYKDKGDRHTTKTETVVISSNLW